MNYKKVKNKILAISTKSVTFQTFTGGEESEVCIYRLHPDNKKIVVWELRDDGIYVVDMVCVAYGL